MEESFDLLAIPIPRDAGWFVLAHSTPDLDSGVPDEDPVIASIPRNWRARRASNPNTKPIKIVESDESLRIRLLETEQYRWFLDTDHNAIDYGIASSLKSGKRHQWSEQRKKGRLESGQFTVINHLGLASIQITAPDGERLLSLSLEIVSKKFDFDTEYRILTEDIAAFCEQLLLNWNAPTSLSFSANPSEQSRLLLEQFLFLRHFLTDEKVGRLLEAISRNPHYELRVEREWKPAATARSCDYLSNPSQMLRSWQRTSGILRPAEVLDTRKRESCDTDPNRFVKFALARFRQLCIEVQDTLETRNSEGTTIAIEAANLVNKLDALIHRPFFRDVGTMTRLPLDNQTLQKREGYREILQAWLLTQAAASLNWTGNEECYQGDSRDVATLYEYWIFIKLYGILNGFPRMEAIEKENGDNESFLTNSNGEIIVNLRSGKRSKTSFKWTSPKGEQLNVDLYYERTFKANDDSVSTGSYSRQFRPDYTLAIYPSYLGKEQTAIASGKVSYLHFDAKYRAEQITELFGEQSENEDENEASILDEKLTAKAVSIYKRGDLLKMHTYNDAVRNTIGSYVLYPGDGHRKHQMEKFHEIAPGVGALSLKPGNEQSLTVLSRFISEVLDHQSDQFSQFRYVSETSYQAHKERPDQIKEDLIRYSVARKDAPCLLLWLRKSEESIFRKHGFAYCRAVSKEHKLTLNLNLSIEVGSEFIPCGGGQGAAKIGLGWRGKVRSARFLAREKLKAYIEERGLSEELKPGSVDHYLLFEFDQATDFKKIDFSAIYRKFQSGSEYMAVTCSWSDILNDRG